MSEDLVGKKLGKYSILREIGAGGMGKVYLGRHAALDQKVAIKVLAENLRDNQEAIERFIQEGRFVAKLRHQHIITVLDLDEEGDTHYLAMEFVEGKPLSELIEQKGKLKPNRALDVARQAAEALHVAHEKGVVHRDIKPDNIMINQEGLIKVMDFGIAGTLKKSMSAVQDEAPVGTLMYMSPEQLQGREFDQRTDIFSLGVVLFQMLTGRLPYSESLAHMDLKQKIIDGPFPAPSYVNQEITEAVENIVLKMTATDPAERYTTARDVADDARHCIRVKAYRKDEDGDTKSGVLKIASIRKMISKEDDRKQQERAKVPRRRDDRDRLERIEGLEKEIKRGKDSRRKKRHAVRSLFTAVFFQDVFSIDDTGSSKNSRHARILDLSEGGVALFLDEQFPVGSRHVVELRSDNHKPIRSPIHVAWTDYMDKHDGFATGFKFEDMAERHEQRLQSALSYLADLSHF